MPYDLLCMSARADSVDTRVKLNVYCADLIHSLRVAELAAVPIKRIKSGREIIGWSKYPALCEACDKAKLWLKIWRDYGSPRYGIVNQIRLQTKKRFTNELAKHRSSVQSVYSDKVLSDTNELWKMGLKP